MPRRVDGLDMHLSAGKIVLEAGEKITCTNDRYCGGVLNLVLDLIGRQKWIDDRKNGIGHHHCKIGNNLPQAMRDIDAHNIALANAGTLQVLAQAVCLLV